MPADKPQIGQIAITINGLCCPPARSKAKGGFSFTQRTFEVEPGNAVGVPNVTQHPDVAAVYNEAIEFLKEVGKELGLVPEDS